MLEKQGKVILFGERVFLSGQGSPLWRELKRKNQLGRWEGCGPPGVANASRRVERTERGNVDGGLCVRGGAAQGCARARLCKALYSVGRGLACIWNAVGALWKKTKWPDLCVFAQFMQFHRTANWYLVKDSPICSPLAPTYYRHRNERSMVGLHGMCPQLSPRKVLKDKIHPSVYF